MKRTILEVTMLMLIASGFGEFANSALSRSDNAYNTLLRLGRQSNQLSLNPAIGKFLLWQLKPLKIGFLPELPSFA